MTRVSVFIATLTAFATLLALPIARANAPVLVLKNGTIVNLDTGIELRPGLPPVRLPRAAIARLVAQHEAMAARRRIDRALRRHIRPGQPRSVR